MPSRRSREGTEHPSPKDAGTIEVAPNPADNLQAEIVYRILSDLFSKITFSIRYPGLSSRPYLIFPSNSPTVLIGLSSRA